ncbi:TerC family protein [Thorsellia anophelis]|uniref:Membrane protein TerC, possibly involved in tellurium resistance n=1 Tax=Thorsellia anophelis DSM 18579 TaxID=1123402 RepID=A0A1I0CKW6_9GAMM|nr:TerC family protein [Thorsellia anophelis]SET20260.1 Membrane protein TerC, possibly involved in tellurium resistance [Thorsellia anophelis DSM 18579]
MEWIYDPTAWAGLVSLILLEIVLGIDNLIFIAILSEKVPKHQRDKARVTGLVLALLMRVGLLFTISWLIKLKATLFTIAEHAFTARDLILIVGGLFLLFKATMELNEKIEGEDHEVTGGRKTAKFWAVVTQIVILDAVFSLDSVITAMGMVEHVSIMIIAVTIAIGLMLLASKPLTRFVNKHPTLVILCLSFLLMIGFSLVAEGFGVKIPKGYLYAAIGFSVLIEIFNQVASFNRKKFLSNSKPLRERTAEAVLNLLSGKQAQSDLEHDAPEWSAEPKAELSKDGFNLQERLMIGQVLRLGERTVNSIMTSRHDVTFLSLDDNLDKVLPLLEEQPHTRLIIKEKRDDDEPIGIVHVVDLLTQQLNGIPFSLRNVLQKPLVFPEQLSLLAALEQFRQAKTHFAFVADEFGSIEGLVTLTDIMETIAGDLPTIEEPEQTNSDIHRTSQHQWIAQGNIALEDLAQHIKLELDKKREYQTLAGLLMEVSERIPLLGEHFTIGQYEFKVLEIDNHKILQVEIKQIVIDEETES